MIVVPNILQNFPELEDEIVLGLFLEAACSRQPASSKFKCVTVPRLGREMTQFKPWDRLDKIKMKDT